MYTALRATVGQMNLLYEDLCYQLFPPGPFGPELDDEQHGDELHDLICLLNYFTKVVEAPTPENRIWRKFDKLPDTVRKTPLMFMKDQKPWDYYVERMNGMIKPNEPSADESGGASVEMVDTKQPETQE